MSDQPIRESGTVEEPKEDAEEDLLDRDLTRRQAVSLGAGAAVTLMSAGTAGAQTATSVDGGQEIEVNFASDYAHNPWINGTVDVDEHEGSFSTLEYIADDGDVADLEEEGFVLAREPDDEEAPHNPVTIAAADFFATDEDGNRVRLDEYAAFPRGATYDDDADSSTDQVDVSALDATHWSTTNATNGSISVTDGENGSLSISTSSVASGETVSAAFDLSSVASSDETITSGVARKFLQAVFDVNTLPSGALVEMALVDSTGGEVTATIDPAGDESTEAVLATSTGDSQVAQARVGELGTIEDIQTIEIRVSETDAAIDYHGINVERESEWVLGSQETQTTDDDGNTIVETVDVTQPNGAYGVTDLSTLDGTPFEEASIATVTYDVEMKASKLPDAEVMARIKDTPDTYSKPKEAEVVAIFESPTAYSLSISFENFLAEVPLPQGRYLGAEVATGISAIEDWEDVDGVSWTSRTDSYSSVGKEVELLSSVAASDRSATRHRYLLDEDEASALAAAAGDGSSAVVMSTGGGGGGGFNTILTVLMGIIGGAGVWFRKDILGALRG